MTRLPLAALALLLALAAARAGDAPPSVGDRVPELHFKDIRFLNRSLDDLPGQQAVVLVATSRACPLAARFFPTLVQLEQQYGPRGVQFLALNVAPDDSVTAM